jgi:hypothetical protein
VKVRKEGSSGERNKHLHGRGGCDPDVIASIMVVSRSNVESVDTVRGP